MMGPMRLRIFTEPQQGASYDQLLAVARCAEEEGFDAFFRSDHYLKMGDITGLPGPTDAWITLAGLARDTARLRLGTLVTSATFRLPGPLAITVAQVDAMSGGRVELGLGAGWFEAEHRAFGIPFPPTGARFERLEEQLAVITGLWSTPAGETFDYKGQHYQLEASPALPKPVQQPHPPLIVGGSGAARTPRLAARFADEYNTPFLQPDAAHTQFQRVREACEAAGHHIPLIVENAGIVGSVTVSGLPHQISQVAESILPSQTHKSGTGGHNSGVTGSGQPIPSPSTGHSRHGSSPSPFPSCSPSPSPSRS